MHSKTQSAREHPRQWLHRIKPGDAEDSIGKSMAKNEGTMEIHEKRRFHGSLIYVCIYIYVV